MAKYIRPVDSKKISASFASHKNRKPASKLPGTDYPVPVGTSVHATADGVVVRANRTPLSGLNIKIAHADGSNSYYLHMSSLWVTVGQRVAQGNVIGKSGNTGNSTGPHLHFSIADSHGILIDPEGVLGEYISTPNPTRRTIKFGSRGADVIYLQTKLGVRPNDGIFGPITRRAVIKFQKSRGLVADGIVGPKTWAALG